MKTARKVEVPLDRPLTPKEYNNLNDHAFNSSMWQASNYSRSVKQLRDKLKEKGYPEDSVEVDWGTEVTEHNMIDDAIAKLQDLRLVDDYQLAESIIKSHLSRGNGISKGRTSAFQKGIPFEVIDEVIEGMDTEDSVFQALDKAARAILRTPGYYRTEDKRKRDQKFVQKLVSKGFSFSDISSWREEFAELLEED